MEGQQFPYPYKLLVFRGGESGIEVLYTSEQSDFVSTLGKIEEMLEEADEIIENTTYYEDVIRYPEEFLKQDGWYLLDKPYWTRVGSGFFPNFVVPREMEGALLFTPIVRKRENSYTFYAIKAEHPLRFPSAADKSAATLCNAVFVPYEPEHESFEDIKEDEIIVEEIGEENGGPKVFGYWPWDPYLLPTRIAYFANTKGIDGPLFLVVHPQAILGGGPEEVSIRLSQLFGCETLGTMVLVSVSFPVDQPEDEEETEE